MSEVREIVGTPEEVGYQLGRLQERGELGPMVWETRLPDRPGQMRVRYLPATPPAQASPTTRQPAPSRPSPGRSLGMATGAALLVLAAVAAAAVWLWRHPAVLVLTVLAGLGVVALARRVRGRR